MLIRQIETQVDKTTSELHDRLRIEWTDKSGRCIEKEKEEEKKKENRYQALVKTNEMMGFR